MSAVWGPDAPRGRCLTEGCARPSPFPFDDHCTDCAAAAARARRAQVDAHADVVALSTIDHADYTGVTR